MSIIQANADPDPTLRRSSGSSVESTLWETTMRIALPGGAVQLGQSCTSGVRVCYSNSLLHRPSPVRWQTDEELVQLLFNVSGDIDVEKTPWGRQLPFNTQQHTLLYSQGLEGVIHQRDPQQQVIKVQFEREHWLGLIDGTTESLQRLGEAVARQQPALIAPTLLHASPAIRQTVDELLGCPYAGGLRQTFVYAKSLELLVLMSDAYQQAACRPGRLPLSAQDTERLWYIRKYVETHLTQTPTLPQLARLAGINELKLKLGFRQLFGQSLMQYVTDYKLMLARQLLLRREATASELAFQLGYSSLPHFSKAFKKKFGYSPRHYISRQPG